MKKIMQYRLVVSDTQDLIVPVGTKLLSAFTEEQNIFVCGLMDASREETEAVTVRVLGTGEETADNIIDFTFLEMITMTVDGENLLFYIFYKRNG